MAVKFRLKGNASFILRDGWITKGLMAVDRDPGVFKNNTGMDELGVGSAMAVSIKYWLTACGLVENCASGVKLSMLGKIILSSDPYINDYFTLWVLHYELVTNPELSTVFYLFFNRMEDYEFDRECLVKNITELFYEYAGTEAFSDKTLADDCGVLINMYGRVRKYDDDPEDNLISPFSGLGLLQPVQKKWKRRCPDYRILPKEAVLYMMVKQMKGEQSIHIESLLSDEQGIGKVCCINRMLLNEYLDELESIGDIRVNRTAGLDIVYLAKDTAPENIVQGFYKKNGGFYV